MQKERFILDGVKSGKAKGTKIRDLPIKRRPEISTFKCPEGQAVSASRFYLLNFISSFVSTRVIPKKGWKELNYSRCPPFEQRSEEETK